MLNETLKKPLKRALLKHGKVNSLVEESQLEPLNRAPVKHGKVKSLEN